MFMNDQLPPTELDSPESAKGEFDLEQIYDVKDHWTDTRDVTHDFDRACGNAGDGARDKFRAALSHVDEVWYTCFRPPSNELLLIATDEWKRLMTAHVS